MRDASETPATPMMPHILRSVSHTSRNGAEIYVSETRDRLLDLSVSQRDAEGPILRADGAGAEERDAELAGQRLHCSRALRGTRNDGATVGFAEQKLVRREACGVRRQIHVKAEPVFLIRAPHRDLGEGDTQPSVRAVVRGAEQATLGPRDEEVDETLLGFQIDAGRLAAHEIAADLPV